MTRSGCAFAFLFSEGSCVVLVATQEEKSLRKDPREADGSTSTEAEHVIKCGQCTHNVYAEVKGKKRRRPQVLEYLNK